MVPLERKLDKVVTHTAISVGEVNPTGYNLPLFFLGFAQSFIEGKRMLKTASHTRQEAFLTSRGM
jgi:hypothetical protein